MPLELWVQAVHHGLEIVEIAVPLIYLEEERSFGGALDDEGKRLEYYHRVLDQARETVNHPRREESGNSPCTEGATRW